MAIACFRLLTVPPLPPFPDLSVPFFFRCIALFTLLPAALPYRAILHPPAWIFALKPPLYGRPGTLLMPPFQGWSRYRLQLLIKRVLLLRQTPKPIES